MTVRISTIVCTYEREGYLRKAVQSLLEQTLDPSSYEVIVVDNGSTDGSWSYLDSTFGSDHARVRPLREPRNGLSFARNTGVAAARGEFVAFFDDDAVATPEWLERIVARFDELGPAVGCVGGAIDLLMEAPRPPWFPDGLAWMLGRFDHQHHAGALPPEVFLPGSNVAIRRELLDALGGFDTSMGRGASGLLGGEENVLQRKVDARGLQRFYDPGIRVLHHAPADRLRRTWFVRRMYWEGVTEGRVAAEQTRRGLLRRCSRTWKPALRASALVVPVGLPAILLTSSERFESGCREFYRLGFLAGLWDLHGTGR